MTPDTPATQLQPRQTSLKGLKLPITIEHFRNLEPSQQNDLVSEQVMGWQLYHWEEECSQFTPGAQWQYGSDYYALQCSLWAPKALDTAFADDEETLLTWEAAYGSRDWVTDIGAAMKLLEALADQQPEVCKYTPDNAIPWTWYCRAVHADNKTVCWHGSEDFEGLPLAIVLTCLEAIGIIDNSPLTDTTAVEEQVLQAISRVPLANVPGNHVNSRYCHQEQTWIIEETVITQDGEEINAWITRYRNGHYVFHVV